MFQSRHPIKPIEYFLSIMNKGFVQVSAFSDGVSKSEFYAFLLSYGSTEPVIFYSKIQYLIL